MSDYEEDQDGSDIHTLFFADNDSKMFGQEDLEDIQLIQNEQLNFEKDNLNSRTTIEKLMKKNEEQSMEIEYYKKKYQNLIKNTTKNSLTNRYLAECFIKQNLEKQKRVFECEIEKREQIHKQQLTILMVEYEKVINQQKRQYDKSTKEKNEMFIKKCVELKKNMQAEFKKTMFIKMN